MVRSDRARLIDKYIETHSNSNLNIRQPIELMGQRHNLNVYRLPINLLTYSIRNGRFAAELLEEEAKLKRKIMETPDDLILIQRLLLEQSKSETQALMRRDGIKNGSREDLVFSNRVGT